MNQKLDEKQARFQSENTLLRLGHIASNLARLRTFCNSAYKEAVESVIDETICFIEQSYPWDNNLSIELGK
jgi:hypothetical protein